MAPPLVLHIVIAFVGQLRARRSALHATYIYFGFLSASSLPSAFSDWGQQWVESRLWAGLFLTAWLPTLVLEVALLLRHLRTSGDTDEQWRTRLVLAALVLGGAFASTDLWADMGLAVPSLAPLGTLLSTLLLAAVAVRFRLLDRNLETATTAYAVAMAISAVLLYLTLFQGLSGSLPGLTFGVTVVTVLLASVVREATSSLSTYRERTERLAVLGRFSAQMAHDLKNPLAALVGAVQVLEADTTCVREFCPLIREQAERIRAIVDQYDRLGRVEPVRTVVQVNDLAKRIVELNRHAATPCDGEVFWSLQLDEHLPPSEFDPDLLSGALENLVRNALEAMPRGGRLLLKTEAVPGRGDKPTLVLTVEDTGEGMDARQAERAFDDFYTTKSTGSGFGLAFVRRVALAHGGDASLQSKRGLGTRIQLHLPMT
jgi:signal transduction histidine kinase